MPYTIKLSNGSALTTVSDQTFDSYSTSLTLLGRGSVNYGPAFDQNFVYLLENFASGIAPNMPLIGQLWYDTSVGLLKLYSGVGRWTVFANVGGLGNTIGINQGTTLANVISGVNRIAGSTGVILTNPVTSNSTTVCMNFSEGKIISIASAEAVQYAVLPKTVTIEGAVFALSSRFPNGLSAGVTLAVDAAGYVNAGLATSSLYADVAERYETSDDVSSGDVVSLGGDKEICLSTDAEDINVLGVVSTAPALCMNAAAGSDETHPFIALIGRVPCKVVGPVRKGQRLVSAGLPGIAKAAEGSIDPLAIVGRALEDKSTLDIALIEIVVGRR